LDYPSPSQEIGKTFNVDGIIVYDGHNYRLCPIKTCAERVPVIIKIYNSRSYYNERLNKILESLRIGNSKFRYVGLRGNYTIRLNKSDMVNVMMFDMVRYSNITSVEADYLMELPDPPTKR
jgi:hypothetical protein